MSATEPSSTGANDRAIGLTLAIASSFLIGSSFVLTKVGLTDASRRSHGLSAGDSHSYLKNTKWWLGMITMGLGEVANFAAYSFAPAILVTPLGALSVLIGAVFASLFLKENLGRQGVLGCALCLIGSVIIVMHAPEDRPIHNVEEMMAYVLQPGFICYTLAVLCASLYLIKRVAPVHGKDNMLVYIGICSLVGSISVMAVKAFGIALKLTFEGSNQLGHLSTWVFFLVVVVSAVTQMNYFNKALELFSTNLVTPIYYVMFTTATITASLVLYQGLNDSSAVDLVSVFCGFATIFIGVFMLNAKGNEENRMKRMASTSQALLVEKSSRSGPMNASGADVAFGAPVTAAAAATPVPYDPPAPSSLATRGAAVLGAMSGAAAAMMNNSKINNKSASASAGSGDTHLLTTFADDHRAFTLTSDDDVDDE